METSFLQDHQGQTCYRHRGKNNVPIVTNLRMDPWEKYPDQSMLYELVG